jgi:hypothetical protein
LQEHQPLQIVAAAVRELRELLPHQLQQLPFRTATNNATSIMPRTVRTVGCIAVDYLSSKE